MVAPLSAKAEGARANEVTPVGHHERSTSVAYWRMRGDIATVHRVCDRVCSTGFGLSGRCLWGCSLRTMHGVCLTTIVIVDVYEFEFRSIVSIDQYIDLFIFEGEQIFNRQPLSISDRLDLLELQANSRIHEKIIYQ